MTMINTWINLIKEGTLDQLTDSCDYVFEELVKEDEYMELQVSFPKTSKCYRVMRAISKKNDKDQESESKGDKSKKSTSSSIPFLTLNSFPDGIFLEITHDFIPTFHIMELKRNPINHIDTISKQFLSAYIHCNFLNSILHFDKSPVYKYYVVYNEEIVNSSKKVIKINEVYNTIRPRRIVPGRPPNEDVFNWYKKNQINFKEFGHKHTFDEIVNIPLISNGEKKERSIALKKSGKLDVFSLNLYIS